MKRGKSIFLVIVVVLLSSSVFAFGVRSMYIENNPLTISPGETKDIKFILESDEEVKVLVQIEEGADIARLIDGEEYVIPADGIKDVNLRVVAPENSIENDYEIIISIMPIEDSGGMVGIKIGRKKTIPIKILGNITEPNLIENKTQDTSSDKEDIHLILNKYSSRESLITATIILLTIIAFIFWIKYNPKNKKSLKKKRKKK